MMQSGSLAIKLMMAYGICHMTVELSAEYFASCFPLQGLLSCRLGPGSNMPCLGKIAVIPASFDGGISDCWL